MLAAMGVDRAAPDVGPILRFQPDAAGPAAGPGVRLVVLDTSWTAGPGDAGRDIVGLREIAARVLADWDLIADTARLLDDWAAASGVVEALTIEGTSFWFYSRLGHWLWLQEQLLWLALADDQVERVRPSAIECRARLRCGPHRRGATHRRPRRDPGPRGGVGAVAPP